MATTVGELLDECSRTLYSGYRGIFNILDKTIISTEEVIKVRQNMDAISEYSELAIGTEIMLVLTTNMGDASITVVRGWRGTTKQRHEAGVLIEVEPRFPKAAILDGLRDEVLSWGRSLYRVDALDVAAGTSQRVFSTEAFGEYFRVIGVSQYPTISGESYLPIDYSEDFALDQATYFGGRAFSIGVPVSGKLRVQVARGFDVSAIDDEETELVDSVGMTENMIEIAKYGAMYRVVGAREVKRTFREADAESRENEAIPPGFSTQTAGWFKKQRDERYRDEVQRLTATYTSWSD